MNPHKTRPPTMQADPGTPVTLESWKEIAAYLQRDAKTARKWEKEEGLPIHRHTHKMRSSVYAYPNEIDRWRASRRVSVEPLPQAPLWRRMLTPSFALAMALCLVMVGNGVRPQVAEAQQGQTRTLICSGADCDGGQMLSPTGKLVRPHLEKGCCTQLSPDGSRVAYTRRSGPFSRETAATEEVIVAELDGAKARTIYRGGSSYAWSADGKRMLIGVLLPDQPTNVANLLWVNIATGAAQKLPTIHTNLDVAKVSPDGKYVAFNASKDGDAEENVYLMASDGSGEIVVSPSAAYQEPVGWTSDGKYLLFSQYGATTTLWAVPFAAGKIQGPVLNTHTEFAKDVHLLGIDRSGAIHYRVVSSGSDIYTATLDTSTGRATSGQIPVPVPGGSAGKIVLPRWSPDSRQLAYMHLGPPREMYTFSFDTGREQRIAPEADVSSAEHCWSRDGSSVFLRNGLQSVRFNLTQAQMTPMFPELNRFNLADCVGDVVLGRTASGGIKVRSLRDGTEKEIYQHQPNAGTLAPVLSHDTRSVAFVTPGTYVASAGRSVIRLVSSTGGPVRDLVGVESPAQIQPYWGVAWSPDDRFLYFAQRADAKSAYELMRVPAAGGAAENMGLKLDDIRDLDIAPDGTRIAFSIGAVNRPEIWALRGFLPAK